MIQNPTEHDIRQRAGANWLARGGGDGHAIDDWLIAEKQLFMELNYSVVKHTFSEGGETLNKSQDPTCRFCDLKRGDQSQLTKPDGSHYTVGFSARNAHTVPTFLGNKGLFSNDECKVCNSQIFSKYENAIKVMLGPYLDAEGIKGRSNVIPLEPKDGMQPRTGSFRRDWVIKTLAKMAISIVPQERLWEFEGTKLWLQSVESTRLDPVVLANPLVFSLECITKGERDKYGLGDRPSSITLYSKTHPDAQLFAHIFLLTVRAKSIQIIVPLTELDKRLTGEVELPFVPAFPKFLFGRAVIEDAFPEIVKSAV